MTQRFIAAVVLCALVCWSHHEAAAAGPSSPPTRTERTAKERAQLATAYLDRRAAAWLRAPAYAGQNVSCAMTCHTTLWYAPARVALGGDAAGTSTQRLLRARLQARVDAPGRWSDQIGFFGKPGSDTRRQSLGSEAVLNALALALMDPPQQPSALTRRALGRMWEAQRDDGAWSWMQFHQEPWEAGNVDWGATLAALAVGHTGSETTAASHGAQLGRLRSYLRRRFEARSRLMTLHDRLYLLWASTRLDGLLSAQEKAQISAQAAARQLPSGAWSLRGLLRTPADRNADGYATGVAALALCAAKKQHATTRKATHWLRGAQRRDGAWPARAISADHSSMADLHLRDGATSMAAMALATCTP